MSGFSIIRKLYKKAGRIRPESEGRKNELQSRQCNRDGGGETPSRFAPPSFEQPKALRKVKGEVLIERQLRQLREAGVSEILLVTGYKAEQFSCLEKKWGVKLVCDPDYLSRNNNGSYISIPGPSS